VSIRGLGDGYAYQRLLWLLVGTVIVPTILLSLFGVAAIRNQGAAVLQELDRLRTERLELGARALAREVVAIEAEMVACAAAPRPGCAEDESAARRTGQRTPLGDPRGENRGSLSVPAARALAIGNESGAARAWSWTDGEGVPLELAALGVPRETGRAGQVVWVVPVDGSVPVAVIGRGDARFAWRLDPDRLQRSLDALGDDRLPEHVALRLAGPDPNAIASFGDFAFRGPSAAALDLPRPLSGWRLVLEDGEDPSRAALSRNAWLYPASLVLLVGLVLVGTVVTLGSAYREIRLSRLQTDFVSSVSHELRTPLTAIRLFVETLQSGRLDPARAQECLDRLSQETDRLSRMIERVLDWARMEDGRRVYEFEAVRADDVAAEALRALRTHHLLDDAPAQIEVRVPDDLPEVRADRDAIVEALLNLLHNAVKHTPPPRRIALTTARRGGYVGIAVGDNGPGIPKADRRRVFEKFYQVDTLLSSPTQGTVDRGSGLGLAIVRAVARAHGGRVELESEVGRGSRFTLWLPIVDR
jgi:two-component system, OmpR family, phosphate regulon sensor histidine kinase PhoR